MRVHQHSLDAGPYFIFLPLQLCNLPCIICHASKSSAMFCTMTIKPRSLRRISKYSAWSGLLRYDFASVQKLPLRFTCKQFEAQEGANLQSFCKLFRLWVRAVGLGLGLRSPEQQPVRKSLAIFGLNLFVTAVSIVRAVQNPRDGFVVMSVSTSANSFVVFTGDRAVTGLKNTSLGKAKPTF